MTIDNGVLDEDHRSLIGLVNQIQEIQPGLMMRSELRLVLTRLHAYAKFHFEREEHLQIAIGFPYAAAHNQGHRSITRELERLSAECEAAGSRAELEAFHGRVGGFLERWLSDHILRSDRLMASFVTEIVPLGECFAQLSGAAQLSQDDVPGQTPPNRQLPMPAKSTPGR